MMTAVMAMITAVNANETTTGIVIVVLCSEDGGISTVSEFPRMTTNTTILHQHKVYRPELENYEINRE